MRLFSALNHLSPPQTGEQELKFFVPHHRSTAFHQWLDLTFERHPGHYASTICSIYFDTPDGSSLTGKVESDFSKTKYRLRWYADETGHPLPVATYLEVKEKAGSARIKYRVKLPVSAEELMRTPLEDVSFIDLFRAHFPKEIETPPPLLAPVLELRYLRRRYVHPVFTDAFCLDSNIRCVRTHAATLPAATGQPILHDVFEQKGASQDPLPLLRPLPRFDVRRASLSKYFLTILQLKPNSELA